MNFYTHMSKSNKKFGKLLRKSVTPFSKMYMYSCEAQNTHVLYGNTLYTPICKCNSDVLSKIHTLIMKHLSVINSVG